MIPAAVIAIGGTFVDDDESVFEGDIEWLAATGITKGCGDPADQTFCPDKPVTRGQMAAFMRRFHNRFIGSAGAPIGLAYAERSLGDSGQSTGNGVVQGLQLDLDVPVPGLLYVTASADMFNDTDSDAFGCGINTGGSVDIAQADSWRSIDLTTDVFDTCATETAFPVTTGAQTVRLIIAGAQATTSADGGSILAVLYPYDSSFGLLGTSDNQTRAREFSDTPTKKG